MASTKATSAPGDAFTEALTDLVFRLPARRFAQAHRGRTHVYEFDWRSPAYDSELGACHAIELPFVFDTLSTVSGPRALLAERRRKSSPTSINKIWVDFAKTGALPWPAYDGTRAWSARSTPASLRPSSRSCRRSASCPERPQCISKNSN